MLIRGDDKGRIKAIKRYLQQIFEMKNLGFLTFLGIEVAYSTIMYFLSRTAQIITKSSIIDGKTVDTP